MTVQAEETRRKAALQEEQEAKEEVEGATKPKRKAAGQAKLQQFAAAAGCVITSLFGGVSREFV